MTQNAYIFASVNKSLFHQRADVLLYECT